MEEILNQSKPRESQETRMLLLRDVTNHVRIKPQEAEILKEHREDEAGSSPEALGVSLKLFLA